MGCAVGNWTNAAVAVGDAFVVGECGVVGAGAHEQRQRGFAQARAGGAAAGVGVDEEGRKRGPLRDWFFVFLRFVWCVFFVVASLTGQLAARETV